MTEGAKDASEYGRCVWFFANLWEQFKITMSKGWMFLFPLQRIGGFSRLKFSCTTSYLLGRFNPRSGHFMQMHGKCERGKWSFVVVCPGHMLPRTCNFPLGNLLPNFSLTGCTWRKGDGVICLAQRRYHQGQHFHFTQAICLPPKNKKVLWQA